MPRGVALRNGREPLEPGGLGPTLGPGAATRFVRGKVGRLVLTWRHRSAGLWLGAASLRSPPVTMSLPLALALVPEKGGCSGEGSSETLCLGAWKGVRRLVPHSHYEGAD